MKKICLALLVWLTAGCAANAGLVYLQYQMTDDPSNQRIQIRYRNVTTAAMCLDPEQWPNKAGKINYGSRSVTLVVGNEKFSLEDFDTGYCQGPCPQRVSPGQEIVGYLAYADFKLPERLQLQPKVLLFRPQGYSCR